MWWIRTFLRQQKNKNYNGIASSCPKNDCCLANSQKFGCNPFGPSPTQSIGPRYCSRSSSNLATLPRQKQHNAVERMYGDLSEYKNYICSSSLPSFFLSQSMVMAFLRRSYSANEALDDIARIALELFNSSLFAPCAMINGCEASNSA